VSLFPSPLDCDSFRQRVHFRDELRPGERAGFDDHAATCEPCARLLVECQQLDDLLLQWSVPPLAARDGRGLSESIERGLDGDGPTASCAETTASLHHLESGDLEPWLAARVERHLARCHECADHHEEVRHSRSLWQTWRAPDPDESFADRLVRRLEPETRAARRRRQLVDWAFGPLHVPRAAAALVLASLTLLSLGLLQARLGGTRPAVQEVDSAGFNTASHRRPVVPIAPATYAPGGRGDPTGSLSREVLPPRRDQSLRSTLRTREGE